MRCARPGGAAAFAKRSALNRPFPGLDGRAAIGVFMIKKKQNENVRIEKSLQSQNWILFHTLLIWFILFHN